jgi:predicted aminopeptidase
VGAVPAYSTLGRLKDPLLSTMLRYRELDVAALIFHELAHQVVYLPGDSAFNEAFATAVEYEGVRRWLEANGVAGDLDAFLAQRRRSFQVADLMAESRERLRRLYAARRAPEQRDAAREAEFARLRAGYDALRRSWGQDAGGDLFAADSTLNNARLAAFATYHQCLPGLERRLLQVERNLAAFYADARTLARLQPAERNAAICGKGSGP